MSYIVKKILALIITMLTVSLLTFTAFSVIPGDAAMARLGTNATQAQVEALQKEMNLEGSLPQRYLRWLGKALQGDFGESLQYDGVSVAELLKSRLPVTLALAGLTFLLIVMLSVPLALFSLRFEDAAIVRAGKVVETAVMAIPPFFLGILITYLFGLCLHWFRPGTEVNLSQQPWQALRYLLFPALSVALSKVAMTTRFLRDSLKGELTLDYVRTARGKGLREGSVLTRHVLPNALIPVITFVALIAAEILGGSLVAEQVFSLNGVGRLMIGAIGSRDFPVVQATVLYTVAVVVVLNTLVDILYACLDPRVRVE